MEQEIKKWLKKIEEVKKGEIDLSRDEDLSIAIMNLISLEEHFYFTAMKTNNKKYLEMLNSVRNLRKENMKKLVTKPEGEERGISKHLLAASMRLSEVGTKELAKNNTEEANNYFKSAFDLFSMFFAINMKIIGVNNIKEQKTDEKTLMSSFSKIIKRIVDCCKE